MCFKRYKLCLYLRDTNVTYSGCKISVTTFTRILKTQVGTSNEDTVIVLLT